MIKNTPDEPEWLKRTLLQATGTELISASGYTILAINGERTEVVDHNSMQATEQIGYYFFVVSEDVTRFTITANDIFYRDLATSRIRYDVKCVNEDVYGWCKLDCIERLESTVPPVLAIMPPNITYPQTSATTP